MYNLLNGNVVCMTIPIVMACEMLNLHPDSDIRICTITDDIAPGYYRHRPSEESGGYPGRTVF